MPYRANFIDLLDPPKAPSLGCSDHLKFRTKPHTAWTENSLPFVVTLYAWSICLTRRRSNSQELYTRVLLLVYDVPINSPLFIA